MPRLVLTPPSASTPGYLKRMRIVSDIASRLTGGEMSAALVDEMAEYILQYVTEPSDKTAARDLLFELSQEEFSAVFQQVNGVGEAAAVPLANEKPSSSGTS